MLLTTIQDTWALLPGWKKILLSNERDFIAKSFNFLYEKAIVPSKRKWSKDMNEGLQNVDWLGASFIIFLQAVPINKFSFVILLMMILNESFLIITHLNFSYIKFYLEALSLVRIMLGNDFFLDSSTFFLNQFKSIFNLKLGNTVMYHRLVLMSW